MFRARRRGWESIVKLAASASSLFEPFDAQELVAQRLFGWRPAVVPEPTIEAPCHGRRSVFAIATAAATVPATPATRMSFRRTARSCAMPRVRDRLRKA
jgi:hypothetical protein